MRRIQKPQVSTTMDVDAFLTNTVSVTPRHREPHGVFDLDGRRVADLRFAYLTEPLTLTARGNGPRGVEPAPPGIVQIWSGGGLVGVFRDGVEMAVDVREEFYVDERSN